MYRGVRANLVREKRSARGRDRLAVCRTRSRLPCALIGCSRQPVVLQTASRSLPEMPIVKIIRNTGNKHSSSSPGDAGSLRAGTRHLPLMRQDSVRVKQPSVGKRRRLAVFRTTNCREQLISAQGRLERVLKAANRLRFMARRLPRTRFAPQRRVREGLSTRSGTPSRSSGTAAFTAEHGCFCPHRSFAVLSARWSRSLHPGVPCAAAA